MSTITIRLNKEEEKLFTEYAKMHNMPLSTLLKKALEEKMEDELDLKAIVAYEKKVAENEAEYFTHEEACNLLESE